MDLPRAPRHRDPRTRPAAMRLPDRGARLLDGGVGHRARIDDDHVVIAEKLADRLAFRDVEPTAQRDDLGLRHGREGPSWRPSYGYNRAKATDRRRRWSLSDPKKSR